MGRAGDADRHLAPTCRTTTPTTTARRIDGATTRAHRASRHRHQPREACGATPLNGFLARRARQEPADQAARGLQLRATPRAARTAWSAIPSFGLLRGRRARRSTQPARTLLAHRARVDRREAPRSSRRSATDLPWLRQTAATLRHADQGRQAARLHRQPAGGAPARPGRRARTRLRRGVPRSALPGADRGGMARRCRVEVSLLSAPKPMRFADEADLLAQIVRRRGRPDPRMRRQARRRSCRRSGKDCPTSAQFLRELVKKAGLPAGHAPRALQDVSATGSSSGRKRRRSSRLPGRWWHALPDGRIQCDLCPRDCQPARRPARHVLRAQDGRRPHGAHHLRPLLGLLRRPGGEEAAQPFLSRHAASFPSAPRAATWPASSARTGTSRSRSEMDRAAGRGLARGDRRGGAEARLQVGRLHLQRPGDLRRVRDGHRRRLPRAEACRRWRSPPATCTTRRGASSTPRWTRPTST